MLTRSPPMLGEATSPRSNRRPFSVFRVRCQGPAAVDVGPVLLGSLKGGAAAAGTSARYRSAGLTTRGFRDGAHPVAPSPCQQPGLEAGAGTSCFKDDPLPARSSTVHIHSACRVATFVVRSPLLAALAAAIAGSVGCRQAGWLQINCPGREVSP